jgi:biotin synthase
MDESTQILCFMAGANSIFYGDRLLTTGNPGEDRDRELLRRLGLHPAGASPEAAGASRAPAPQTA